VTIPLPLDVVPTLEDVIATLDEVGVELDDAVNEYVTQEQAELS
jgi:exonuclease VII small subunit